MPNSLTRSPVSSAVACSLALGLGCACAMSAGCQSSQPSQSSQLNHARAPSMALEAFLVENPNGQHAEGDQVMTLITVRDAAGAVVSSPRIFTYIGQPASLQVGDSSRSMTIEVNSTRSAEGIVVSATLTNSDGAPGATATTRARSESLPVQPRAGLQ